MVFNLADLPRPFFALAPMDDVTDTVFRQIIASCAKPNLYFSEFSNVDCLQSKGRSHLLHKLKFLPLEQPIFAQVWGKNPENYFKTVKELAKMGFAGIDINMGCPEKKVIKNGCCSALINNRSLAAEIIAATQEAAAGNVPVSVKIRTGFDKVDFTWPQFILEQGIDMLSVHLRTTKEMSKPPARWGDIARVVEIRDQVAPQALIVGNGDVASKKQGRKLANLYKVDGIMIGRGILSNPYIFSDGNEWHNLKPSEKIDIYKRQIKLFGATWQNNERYFQSLKKFAHMYINSFDGASKLRSEFVRKQTLTEMLEVLNNFEG
jgi:tRNA-dihydrouridine synthase